MRKNFVIMMMLGMATSVMAEKVEVKSLQVAGPYNVTAPMLTSQKDANGKEFKTEDLLWNSGIDINLWKTGKVTEDSIFQGKGIYLAGYTVQNTGFAKANFYVNAKGKNTVYVDGVEQFGEVQLVPGRHDVVVKLLETTSDADTVRVSLDSEQSASLVLNAQGKRYWTLHDLMNGERLSSVSLSASGRFVLQHRYITRTDTQTEWTKEIMDTQTGNRYEATGFVQWAAKGDRFVRSRRNSDGNKILEYVDPLTGKTQTLCQYNGQNHVDLAACDTKLIVSIPMNGPEEKNRDVHQILEPDDRQPGWRDRSNVSIYDIKTGITTPVTAGQHNVSVILSDDGSKALVTVYSEDVTERPFTFSQGILLNLETGAVDTLYKKDGFIESAQFSADGSQILFKGSPEAFSGVGNTLSKDLIPNSYEYELFLMDVATKNVKCLTRDFDPSIAHYKWSRADGLIYTSCEDVDLMSIFSINPKTGKIQKLQLQEPYVFGWNIAREKPVLAYYGESGESTDRSWVKDLKTGKEKILNDLNPTRLKDIQLGKCISWDFKAERGDTIHGCYFLPPYFDETKQYPMLVYYYGGCSPTGRYLDSYYCYQEWAAMGYVVYLIQPSGCSGQGQEFARRHVNTYGDYTADDIIQGTKEFCKEHPWVNAKKIGCLGASYGGFMTQYLQTKTDIFAAAVSHAGISNPASYWGYGYWGYSYSSTSAAHSYPWNNEALFSGHAPLFHADKIHTPLLFMHGSVDTNVPINESIQMFNALKILGRETAFIVVEGQDHHILDYNKRIRWHDSIMAWFARWLQDDSTWWNTMYPEKNL